MLMIHWLFYTFNTLGYYFYQMNGGVSLSCFIGCCYTTTPIFCIFKYFQFTTLNTICNSIVLAL